jgi:hypothetical protein
LITFLLPAVVLLLGFPKAVEPRPNGEFILQPRQGESVAKAVDHVVARMNFLLRPFARRRLMQTNRPAQELQLSLGPGNHEIRFDTRAPIWTPAGGQAITWIREDGEQFLVRTTLTGSELVQRFEAPDGSKTNRYQVDPDGLQLRLHVTVESPQLPSPLTYTLIYRRKAP